MNVFTSLKDAGISELSLAPIMSSLLAMDVAERLEHNDGGMKLLGALSLSNVITCLQPDVYVELGSWKGLSLVVADNFLPPEAKIFAFDPFPKNLQFKPERVCLSDQEWGSPVFGRLTDGASTSLLFADDHQDALERLLVAWSRNYDYVLFDDDYSDKADHRTLRNSLLREDSPSSITNLLREIVDFVCLISNPLTEIQSERDFTGHDHHWRDQALVKLKRPGGLGWTMGKPVWKL